MRYKLNRDMTFSSTVGISMEMKKGEFHFVPSPLVPQVVAAGGVPETEVEDEAQAPASTIPTDPDARKKAVYTAFEVIIARNARDDFTAANSPSVDAVKRELGWSMTKRDLAEAWASFAQQTKT